MHFVRHGSGPVTYVGLHGWGGTHATFTPLTPYLPDTASLYAADLPGYGLSPRPRAWSTAVVADEIVAGIDSLGVADFTLIGNCSGAIFALLVATLMRDRSSRVVLIDPFAFVPWYFKVFVHPVYGRIAYRSTFANPFGRWVTNVSLKRHRTGQADLTRSFAAIDHDVSIRYLGMLNALDDIQRFKAIDAVVDIAHGERTFLAVRQSMAMWQHVWPMVTINQIAGAGHLPLEEASADVAALIFGRPDGSPERRPAIKEPTWT